MKCPNCNETLVMTDRQGVEIDYCPKCRGVWLDRGELDKLIERTGLDSREPGQDSRSSDSYQQRDRSSDYDRRQEDRPRYHDDDDHHGGYNNDQGHHKKHKKEGFLGDL